MKINNETKVGILAVVAIFLLVLGFNFLKGKSIFSKQPTMYAVFTNLGGLEKSNIVKINGLAVGTVYNLTPTNKEVDSILVEIHLNRELSIPENSLAYIDASLVGSSYIAIEKGDSRTFLEYGDTIRTRIEGGLIADIKTQLTPTITKVNQTVDSLKSVLSNINSILDPATNNNLKSTVEHLAVSTAYLQKMLNTESGMIAQTLGNLNSVTGNLAKNNDGIAQSIRNVEITTGNLANARIQQTVAALEGTINEMKGTISKLDENLNSNKGTLGRLMNDQKLYEQMNRSALSLEILLDDLRVHPKRYVNVSVFGRKGTPEALTSPAIKDTIPVSAKQ
ncbi:MAG TPA: MlaD family protein [Chitinophagaceae bacterium]|jgi:phospholipid/cholesterol/gamma-HCH transport system substrate-binding protein|nr:MlaD family protein [Chitinophagaceae bacterium]